MAKIKISDLCISFFGNQCQDIENAARKLLYNIDVDNSEGVQLDNIGDIVGQDRLGYNDEYYRILLKVKMGINVSEGEIERILTLWRTLTGSSDIILEESYPAKIKLTTSTYYADAILIFMKDIASQALAGGVGIATLIIHDPTKFGFSATMGGFDTQWANSY